MSFLDYFLRLRKKEKTAHLAKERLQIIVAYERATRQGPDILPSLQQEILAVIRKYYPVEIDQVKVKFDKQDEYSLLELNVVLPDEANGQQQVLHVV